VGAFLLLYLIHFWWWEFRLQAVQRWTFPLYFFISMYAVIQYLVCVLLFPEEMADYDSFKERRNQKAEESSHIRGQPLFQILAG
jgi:hypothetical protein